MMKLAIICISSSLILATGLQKDKLRLHSVETYEIQPGTLAMPTYSDSGELCNAVLEKRHVSPKGVDLDAEISREEIYQIFDELAPREERGQSELNLPDGGDLTISDGGTLTTIAEYENVSLQMHGKYKKVGTTGYVAAIIHWKTQKCSHEYPDDRDSPRE